MNGTSGDSTTDPNIKNSENNIVQQDKERKDLDTSHDLSDPDAATKQKQDEPSFSFSTLLAKKKPLEVPDIHFNANQEVPNGFVNSNSQPELYSKKRKKPVQFHDDFDMLTQSPNLDMDLVKSPTVDATSNNNNNNINSSKTHSIQIANSKIMSRYTKKNGTTSQNSPFAVPPVPVTKKSKAPNKIVSSLPEDEEFSVVDLNDDQLQARTNTNQNNEHDNNDNFLSPTSAKTASSRTQTPNSSSKTPSPNSNNNSHSDNNNTSHNSNGSSTTPKRLIPFIVDLESDEDDHEGIPNGQPNTK